ncbi:MAG: MFS transporter [Armatimonadetes bacterium]|nr:MFS transporter [Armatimonadota bacterium]
MSRPASRLDALRNLQTANLDVAFATAFATLVGGTFLIGFIQYAGGSDRWIQLAVALPSLMGLFQIPGAIWGRRFNGYKRFVAPGGWVWRLLYIPLFALPLVPWPGQERLIVLAFCIALATAANQLVSPIYNDWIAELVPAESRGWYFSRRTAVSTAVGMGVAFIGGVMLDQLQKKNMSGTGFSILFAAGSVCAMVSMFFFLRMKDTERANPIQAGLKDSLKLMVRPAGDRNFQRVLVFTVVFMVSATLAGGLYVAFARESLQLSYTAIQLTQVAHAIGTVAFANMWGYLADKYGNKPLLAILMIGATITPFVWLVCRPGQPEFSTIVLVIGHLFNGLVWSGIAVCQMNLYIATAKTEDRANYLGMVFAVQAFTGAIAPLIGGEMMHFFRGTMPVENAYKSIFVAVMLVRVVSFLTLLPVREEGSTELRETFGHLRKVNTQGIRALRKLTRTGDPVQRAEAIAEVGSAQMALASAELLKALSDPSPLVRRHAARALGRLDDPAAAAALTQFVTNNRELVEEETLEALGDMAATGASQAVTSFLNDPRSPMRRQAAKTLGRLGEVHSLGALEAAASDPTDPDLRRAAIQALRLLSARDSTPFIGKALQDPAPSVRSAAAEAVSELGLVELADEVRAALQVYADSYSSELAYALGCVGSREDLPALLQSAAKAASSTTRRRCLLGIAKMLGVEQQFYRLLGQTGLSRDQELVALLKPAYQKSKKLREAVQVYSLGDEKEAVALLVKSHLAPELGFAAEHFVPEMFLVLALAYAQHG